MKKIKLNAVLASVLSLGIACSSCVHASGKNLEVLRELVGSPETFEVQTTGEYDEAEIASRFERFENRYECARGLSEVYARAMGEKNVDLQKEFKKASYRISAVYLVRVLDSVLGRIFSLSQKWSPKTMNWFSKQGWKDFPRNSYEFIEKIGENSDFSEKLKCFCEYPSYIKIGSERNLFSDLVNISEKIEQFYSEYITIE